MKSAIFHVLVPAVTFFGLCASANAACSQSGGGARPFPSNQNSSPFSLPSGTVTQNLTAQKAAAANAIATVAPSAPAAPQARLTVVTASESPVGNLQIASPRSEEKVAKNAVVEVPVTDDKPAEVVATATPAPVATPEPVATPVPSKIDDAIKGLVGTWMAVSRQGNGELSTVELQLDNNGWAKLTVPGADGKPSTTTRKVEYENSELKLTGDDADVLLGKLVEFDARQMVLERSGGQVTFVRP